MKRSVFVVAVSILLFPAHLLDARESMATIDDPDGYTNVRDADNKVIARVTRGEFFLTWESTDGSKNWDVWLRSGVRGYIHQSRIHLLPEEPIMKLRFPEAKKEWRRWAESGDDNDNSEVDMQAKSQGIDYGKTLLQASEGDARALKQFFSLNEHMDGAAAESHFSIMWELFHVVGDETFADFLKSQSTGVRKRIGKDLISERTTWPISDGKAYLKRHFPKTFALIK